METISENSAETETCQTSPDLPGPRKQGGLSAKSSKVSSIRGRDPQSRESLTIFGTLSVEERSIADAMNTYVSIASGELPPSGRPPPRESPEPVRHQQSLTSIESSNLNLSTNTGTMSSSTRDQTRSESSRRSLQPFKTLLPLPHIDTSKPFSSFSDCAPQTTDEESATQGTDNTTIEPTSLARVRQFMLESQKSELRFKGSQRSLRQTRYSSDTPPQIDFPLPADTRHRERQKPSPAAGHTPPFHAFYLPQIPEARTDNETSDSSAQRTKTSSSSTPARRKGKGKLSPNYPGFINVGIPSLTDSGVQADEEDNNMDGDDTPRAVTLTHDMMASMMETTPLLKSVYKWHVEERYFTEDLTAFACDPRTRKSVGYLPTGYRECFQRLHNPLVAFGYEVQRYCMRYIGGYDLSVQIQLLQKSQEGRDHKRLFRDSGIGSDLEQNCGCESGRSCRRQGSSRDMERRSPTPPPRLSIPCLENSDDEDDLIGLGITNGPFFPPQPPSSPSEPEFPSLQKTDSAPSIRTLRKKGKLPSKETLKEVITSTKSEKAKGKCREIYIPSPEAPTSSPDPPPNSKRRRRTPDDCPRLPKLQIPDLYGPGLGDSSSSSSAARAHSRTSSETTGSTASQRTATMHDMPLPPKPEPLTPEQSNIMVKALYTTMEALIVMRDFMSDLDDVYSIVRLPHGECNANYRATARRRFYYELLPQSDDRIDGTVSILEEQAGIIGDVLDGYHPDNPNNPQHPSALLQPHARTSHHSQPPATHRGTSAWARATAAEGTMTGGLPPRRALSASSLLLSSAAAAASYPRRFNHPLLRPISRICCACTRVRFHALQQLVRFRFLDSFTYWNLERLENRLDKLRVDDGHEGAGAFCAMRYTVQGLAQDIIARRGKQIGIADTEERMSMDSEGWDRAGECGGQAGWVSRVLGPRGRKNASAWKGDEDAEERRRLVGSSCPARDGAGKESGDGDGECSPGNGEKRCDGEGGSREECGREQLDKCLSC